MVQDRILILDFGSQYTQLIARRVRESWVNYQIVPYHFDNASLRRLSPKGLILSGGPASVYDTNAPQCDSGIFTMGVPILGICYGMQLLVHLTGGEVARSTRREYGRAQLHIDDRSDLFAGIGEEEGGSVAVWMSHGDRIREMPSGFTSIAHTDNSPVAAICDRRRAFFGLQFHPEVEHTPCGRQIFKNFLFSICGCTSTGDRDSFIDQTVSDIRARVAKKRVICALSGGIDSAVTALLVHRAVADQLICLFVDTGLLRQGEVEEVLQTYDEGFGLRLELVRAEERFLKRLQGVTDPEEKRLRIGDEFIKVFKEVAQRLGSIEFLAQGTLYPDVIESSSAGGPSAVIKSHHNVGGLPKELGFSLIEPLKDLFKDEVRELGEALGIPPSVVHRQPFPGPGLAIRVLGEVNHEHLALLRQADAIVQEEVRRADPAPWGPLWQAFAVLLPVRTVGVMGDERTYEHVVAIRAVTSVDGMTADWARLPHSLLERMASRLINEVKGINRVVYDISSKPPSTIEWE